jgi:hypothetical protein
MKKGEIYLDREILYTEDFPANGTFQAFYSAEARLKDLGYQVGSMCRQEPIGFADNEKCSYVAKWYNIGREDRGRLDGVMLSNDFREGSVQIIFFNPPKL